MTKYDRIPVENLQVQQTIVNVGIIQQISSYPDTKTVCILFSPCAENQPSVLRTYKHGTKLMIS